MLCCLLVCLSLYLSVTFWYANHTGLYTSEIISRLISLRVWLGLTQHRRSGPTGTPAKFGWNRGGSQFLGRKPAMSVKCHKIGPRLLWQTNRKSHTVHASIGTIISDLGWPWIVDTHSCRKGAFCRAHQKNLNEDRPILSMTKMYANDSSF